MIRAVPAAMVAFAAIACNTPAWACSPVPGYQVPTNLDLAVAGETIVLATVESERKGEDAWSGTVVVKPTLLIKGSALPTALELEGAGLQTRKRKARRSDPSELRRPNPDALIGGCVRYIFAKGMQLVLFLAPGENGKLMPYRRPFSRDAEDVAGPDALWVRAVREYAAISTLPEAERRPRMAARITELRTMRNDSDASAIADDLQIELSGTRLPPYD